MSTKIVYENKKKRGRPLGVNPPAETVTLRLRPSDIAAFGVYAAKRGLGSAAAGLRALGLEGLEKRGLREKPISGHVNAVDLPRKG